VYAPFAGTITQRNVDVGALVTAGSASGQPLFRLADSKSVRLFVDVPQALAPGIRTDTPTELLVREYQGRSFPGKVARTSGAVDPRSRTLRTEIEIPNSSGALLPGMFARVKFALTREQAGLLIPASALVVTADGTRVAVVSDDDRVHFKKVEIASDTGTELAIASGLAADDRVVTNPGQRLIEGDHVEVAPNDQKKPKGD
jgi:RND family efflux transporter MFP subunit